MSERPNESESMIESEIEKCKTSHRWFSSQTKNRMVMTTLWSVKPLSPRRWSPKVNSEIRKNVHIQQKRDIMMMMSTVIMMTMMMRIMTMINCALSCPPMTRN